MYPSQSQVLILALVVVEVVVMDCLDSLTTGIPFRLRESQFKFKQFEGFYYIGQMALALGVVGSPQTRLVALTKL